MKKKFDTEDQNWNESDELDQAVTKLYAIATKTSEKK